MKLQSNERVSEGDFFKKQTNRLKLDKGNIEYPIELELSTGVVALIESQPTARQSIEAQRRSGTDGAMLIPWTIALSVTFDGEHWFADQLFDLPASDYTALQQVVLMGNLPASAKRI